MNITVNWTTLITNAAGLTVVAGFMWKGFRLAEKYVAERTAATIQNQSKQLAQQERISVLEGLAEIHGERFDQIEEYLAKPPEDRTKLRYTRRKANPRLEKKAIQRYKQIDTDFT